MATIEDNGLPRELLESIQKLLASHYGKEQKKNEARIKELEQKLQEAEADAEAKLKAWQEAVAVRDGLRRELASLKADEDKIRRQAEAAVRAALGAKAPRPPRSNGKNGEVRNTRYVVKYVNGDGVVKTLSSHDGALTDYTWGLNRIDKSVPTGKAAFLDAIQAKSGVRPFSADHEAAPDKTIRAKFDKIEVLITLL